MERTQILDTMAKLKLYGMKAAYDELIASAVKRQHEPQRVVVLEARLRRGDLLQAEISENEPTRRHRSEPGGEWRDQSSTR